MSTKGELSRECVYNMVETAAKASSNSRIIDDIRATISTCAGWASVFEELLDRFSMKCSTFVNMGIIQQHLNQGKLVFLNAKLPGGIDYTFAIQSDGKYSQVVHGYSDSGIQNCGTQLKNRDMVALLNNLSRYDHSKRSDVRIVRELYMQLWGRGIQPQRVKSNFGSTSVDFSYFLSGEPRDLKFTGRALSYLHTALSDSAFIPVEYLHTAGGYRSQITGRTVLKTAGYAGVFGAVLGFVFGAGGTLLFDDTADWGDILLCGAQAGAAMGAAELASGLVAQTVRPRFAAVGASVVRTNAAAGIAAFGVVALWDVARWKAHDITAVELRKNLASGAGGAAGGFAAGAATGALAGVAGGGPIGIAIGALVGGIVGGIGGSIAGKKIDRAIWSEGEDSVMDSYEFFGWHNVPRHTRPHKSAMEITEAYCTKLEQKPSKITYMNWSVLCTATLMILLQAMYPELKKLLDIAENLRGNGSQAFSILATAVYEKVARESQRVRTRDPAPNKCCSSCCCCVQ